MTGSGEGGDLWSSIDRGGRGGRRGGGRRRGVGQVRRGSGNLFGGGSKGVIGVAERKEGMRRSVGGELGQEWS